MPSVCIRSSICSISPSRKGTPSSGFCLVCDEGEDSNFPVYGGSGSSGLANAELLPKQPPIVGEAIPQHPIADTPEAVLLHEIELGLKASFVLIPNHVILALIVPIPEGGSLGRLVVIDRCLMPAGQFLRRYRIDFPGKFASFPVG